MDILEEQLVEQTFVATTFKGKSNTFKFGNINYLWTWEDNFKGEKINGEPFGLAK